MGLKINWNMKVELKAAGFPLGNRWQLFWLNHLWPSLIANSIYPPCTGDPAALLEHIHEMTVDYILWYGSGAGMSYLFIFVLWTTEVSLQHPSRNECHCPGAIGGSYQKLEQDWERFLVDPLYAAIFSQVWGDSCLCFILPKNSNKAMSWISACSSSMRSYLEINIAARLNI